MSNNNKTRRVRNETPFESGYFRATLFALQDTWFPHGPCYVVKAIDPLIISPWMEIVKVAVMTGLLTWLGVQDFDENGSPRGPMWLSMSELAQAFKKDPTSKGDNGSQHFSSDTRKLRPSGKLAVPLLSLVHLMKAEATKSKSKFAQKSHLVDGFEREIVNRFNAATSSDPANIKGIQLKARPISTPLTVRQMIKNRQWCQANAVPTVSKLDSEVKIDRLNHHVAIELVYIHEDNTEKVVFQSNVEITAAIANLPASEGTVAPTPQRATLSPERIQRSRKRATLSARARAQSPSPASVATLRGSVSSEEEQDEKDESQFTPHPNVPQDEDDDGVSVLTNHVRTTPSEPDCSIPAAAATTPLQLCCTNPGTDEMIENHFVPSTSAVCSGCPTQCQFDDQLEKVLEKPQDPTMEWLPALDVAPWFPLAEIEDLVWSDRYRNYTNEKKRKSCETSFRPEEMHDDSCEDAGQLLKKGKFDALEASY